MGLQNGILNNINQTYIFGGDNASMILTFGDLPFSGVNFRVNICHGSHGSISDASHWIYFMRGNFCNCGIRVQNELKNTWAGTFLEIIITQNQ